MDATGTPPRERGEISTSPVVRRHSESALRITRTLRDQAVRHRVTSWLRSSAAGRVRRWVAISACAAVLGMMWSDSSAEEYSGLPINVLGQITGDLVMMGIAFPVVLPRRPREERHEGALGTVELAAQLNHTTRRIQLLEVASALFPAAQDDRGAILAALRAALSRDVTVEILLPEPARSAGRDGRIGQPTRTVEEDLVYLRDEVPTGILDVQHYRETPPLALARCDDRLWITFTATEQFGAAAAGADPERSFLCLDTRTHNARAVTLYFARLADAGRCPRTRLNPARTGAPARLGAPRDRASASWQSTDGRRSAPARRNARPCRGGPMTGGIPAPTVRGCPKAVRLARPWRLLGNRSRPRTPDDRERG